MRLAFSTPTPSSDEQEALFCLYRGKGYEGLQLKAAQYVPYLDEPDGAVRIATADPGRFSGLIFGGRLDEAGQDDLRRVINFAALVAFRTRYFLAWPSPGPNHPRRRRSVRFGPVQAGLSGPGAGGAALSSPPLQPPRHVPRGYSAVLRARGARYGRPDH